MAKRKSRTKFASRTNSSSSSGEALIGLALIALLIAGIAIAIALGIVLFPLILIPMWLICKEWSRGIKLLISTLILIIWILLLPFALGFLGEVITEFKEDSSEEYSQSTSLFTSTPSATNSPLPTSTPIPMPTLSKGMSGEYIITLQNRLIELRYLDGEADGQFGPKTERAVMSFQKKNGIIDNGIADTYTLAQLFSNNALGYYSGDLEWLTRADIPTYYGSNTHAKYVWNDIGHDRIIFADSVQKYKSGFTVLHLDGYSSEKNEIIRDISVYFENCIPPVRIDIDEAVKIASGFFPYEIAKQWYEFDRSFYQASSSQDGYDCYICCYNLTEKASKAYYDNQHSYSGRMDIIFYVNKEGYVDSFRYCFANRRHYNPTKEWNFDFLNIDY